MKLIATSKKSIRLENPNGAVWFVIAPGFMLMAALLVLIMAFDPMPYREGSLIPLSIWPYMVMGMRVLMVATGGLALYIPILLLAQFQKDGYIDALVKHSEELKQQRGVSQE